jgi:hypothetical protein
LDLEARRARSGCDLAVLFAERFPDQPVRVVERGYAGRSVTVEMSDRMVDVIRKEIPYVTVERARAMNLLED